MSPTEIKFLFDGIIFSSNVFIEHISDSLNRYEVTINFLNRYLISKYRECYFFVLENNKFKPVHTENEKEHELVKTLQDAINDISEVIIEKQSSR